MPLPIKNAFKKQFLYLLVFQKVAGRRLFSLLPAGWQETLMLVTAGWQETKKSPASRLAGDLAINYYENIAMCTWKTKRTDLCVCNYGYAPLSQIFRYLGSRKLWFNCPAMFKMSGSAATDLDLFCWLRHFYNRWMDDLRFYVLFNKDDAWMIMKGCVQWNSVYGWEDFTSNEDRTRSARSEGQRLTNWATGAPGTSIVRVITVFKISFWHYSYFREVDVLHTSSNLDHRRRGRGERGEGRTFLSFGQIFSWRVQPRTGKYIWNEKGDRYWQPAVTSESSLETASCLQRTFAGDSQLKYMDVIWTKKSIK